MNNYTAQQLIDKLALKPHVEGGWFAFVWQSETVVAPDALPSGYTSPRSTASLIYFMLKAEEVSRWHWLRSAEIWTWHAGGSLEMTLGGSGEGPIEQNRQRCGPRLEEGESYTIVAPADSWQTTRVIDGDYVLVSCVVSPAFNPDDFILSKE